MRPSAARLLAAILMSMPVHASAANLETAKAAAGLCFSKDAKPETLIRFCTEAIASRLLPDGALANAHYRRAFAFHKQYRFDDAVSDLDVALHLSPDFLAAYALRAEVYFQKREHGKSVEDWSEILKRKPNDDYALWKRGIAHDFAREHDSAITDFSDAIEIAKKPDYFTARGEAYWLKGELPLAVADHSTALELAPDLARPYYNRGRARFDMGEFAAASADLATAADREPSNHYFVIWAYLAAARAGQDARGALERRAAALDLATWPGPIVSMFLGKLEPDALVAGPHPVGWIERGPPMRSRVLQGPAAPACGPSQEGGRILRGGCRDRRHGIQRACSRTPGTAADQAIADGHALSPTRSFSSLLGSVTGNEQVRPRQT